MSETSTPTWAEVIKQAIEFHMSGVFTGTIARVLSYDATKKRASLQPVIQERYRDERGQLVTRDLPVLEDVPVILPGSGGTRIKFPVAVDDTVLVVFLSQSADQFFVKGGKSVDPEDDRRNVLSDAVCFPNLQSFKDASDAGLLIEFTSTAIKLGAGAVDAAIKGTAYRGAEDVFLIALGVYLAALGAAVPGMGGPAGTFATALSAFQAAILGPLSLSTKVKVE